MADTALIDFEQDESFELTVSVTDDSGATTDTAQVTVAITDVAPAIGDQTVGAVDETSCSFGAAIRSRKLTSSSATTRLSRSKPVSWSQIEI